MRFLDGKQKIEWKRQWRDEFMKGLCGLSNAQGGTLEIGRDDEGSIVGIDNARNFSMNCLTRYTMFWALFPLLN
jgi:ATP-dependent DNA helicase RecG